MNGSTCVYFTSISFEPFLSCFFLLQVFKLLLCEGPFKKKKKYILFCLQKEERGKTRFENESKRLVETFIIFSIEELVKVVEDFASESWQNVDV